MIGFRSRGGDQDLPTRLEALAEAVTLAEDRLDQEAVAFAGHVVTKAEARLRHGTTHTLVALLGATGSGKSSVTNTLVGADVATTGVRRPTTSSTLACIWGSEDAGALLDWLEVVNRHQVGAGFDGDRLESGPGRDRLESGLDGDRLHGLILLDVPDHDSVALAHREEMERIAEHADVLVWVTDPEKYADKAMHDYLARLSGHGSVMALVLNKIDLLSPDDAAACRADLGRLLADPGLDAAPIVALSAQTGAGRADLVEVLADAVEHKQAAVARLAADTSLAANELAAELGSGSGPDRVPSPVADRLATDLADASGLGPIADAVAAGHRRDGAKVTGWPFTRWLRRLRPHPLGRLHLDRGSAGRASLPEPSGVQRARSKGAIRETAEAVARDLPDPWPSHIRTAASPEERDLADRIDVAVGDAVRHSQGRAPRWWTAVGGLQWLLAAAAITGAIWLALLAVAAYLRIPEPPTPERWGFPLPTTLLLGGLAIGLVVAAVSARVNRVGGRRRARAVRRRAEDGVAEVADELVITPIQLELDRYNELHRLLDVAGADR